MSKIEEYFKELENKTKIAYVVAEEARKKGLDPLSKVEVPLATSLAGRVAGLISAVYPQLNNPQIINRIVELEKEYGSLDPAVCLKIAEETAKEKFCKFTSHLEAIDAGIRLGFAYITLGVVSSPIEGFTEFKLRKRKDGKDYFSAYYSGPIRSAGGTGASVSLLIIDYLREIFGYEKYDPDEREIKRIVTELYDYHERITNLQYLPTEEEIEFLVKNIPIQIDGEPSEDREVSNYKDLERIETNLIRGGACLVIGEGIAQKAAKILKMVKKLREKGFKLSAWDFLEEYVALHKKREEGKTKDAVTYIQDLVAGRPVLGHPSRSGAFRLRYGRARNSGYSCLAIHPATMAILNNFIAIGSQLKIEMPTKAAAMASCDSIEGPIVKLRNGSVRKLKDRDEAKNIYNSVEEIVYLGDLLVPYGDFANRNHVLMPSGYCEQEWLQELKIKAGGDGIEIEDIYNLDFASACEISEKFSIPLHPKFIFYWSQINYEDLLAFLDWLSHGRAEDKIIFPYNRIERERFCKGKRALELLGIEHEVVTENVLVNKENSKALLANLGLSLDFKEEEFNELGKKILEKKEVLELINFLARYKIMDKAGTFIGSRMGRPEKAKLRKLAGSPNVLFPVGEEGGRLRSVNEACEFGSVKAELPIYFCENCNKEGIYFICECGKETKKMNYCPECKQKFYFERCPEHLKSQSYMAKRIEIKNYFGSAAKKLDLLPNEIPKLVKGVRGTSNKNHMIENLAKGLARALMNLQVNKDGTIRFDATEMPLTHFKAREIGTSIEKLKDLGYKKDIYGKELENEEQVLEIFPHDIILPCCPESNDEKADVVFIKVAGFIDLLLERFYGMKAFYNIRSREDLVGHLMACIAPHNCASVLARIIGFSKTQALLASPYIHAAMRRDCLGYNSYVPIEEKGNWRIIKIGEFVENLNPNEKADNFGTLKKKVSGIKTFGNPGKGKIVDITKHAPRRMLRVYLEDGRKIESTESHRIYLKGKIEKRAYELKVGDKLMVSYKKNIREKNIKEIFLPEIFKNREDAMLRGIRTFLGRFEKLSKHENFCFRDSFPITFVQNILKKHGKTLEDLPSETRIAIKRDNISLPIRIPMEKELMEVIGLYIAEGYCRKNDSKKGFYQVFISSSDKKIRDFIKKTFSKYFNLKPSEDHEDHVTFSSRIIYELFADYFKTGSKAREKRIPSLFLNLKKDKLSALLRGYFEGDGSVSLTDTRVICDTISEGLKYDLSFALSRFGIFTKFYDYEKEPGPKVREFYIRKNRKIPKFKITRIIIPSGFVRKFLEIGFLSEKKKEILEKIGERRERGMKIDFDEEYAYPKVIKIEEAGEKESYCFNVSGEHNFFVNEVLVHNCDGDESAVMLLLDMLLNFSREYLPAHRGGTQDAPLVLNIRIRAGEVDDMVFDVDVERELPLSLYEAARKKEHPSKVKISQIRDRIGKQEFKDLWYEYEVSDINAGVLYSSYKKFPSMKDKVEKEMELVEKIRAVNAGDVARLIIDRHFIRDIRGNLRKFSQQEFRCSKCNEKYRRPPLVGRCLKCNGNIIFTISEGSIVKYLEPALNLAEKYNVPAYLKQSLELAKSYIESIFGKEKEKQEALKKWF